MPYVVTNKIAFLSEASKVLSSSLDYNVTLAILANLVVNNIADYCLIDIFEDGKMKRLAVRAYEKKHKSLADKMYAYPPDPKNKEAIYKAAITGTPILIKKVTKKWLQDASKIPAEREIASKLNLSSFVFAPLKSRGRVIGVLTVASSKKNFQYSEEDVVFIEELANRAGIAVDKAQLFSQAQDALRVRDEFLSIASHELKTPLTSILLNLQLILHKLKQATDKKQDIDEIEKMVEISMRQSNRMSRLITDLLNTSVISTGRMQIEKEQMSLSELVLDIVSRFDAQLKKAKITIHTTVKPDIVGTWDKIRMEQVISNLISNAIKYGADKPIQINLEKKGGFAILEVRDQGIGIKKEDLSHIFERFTRGVNSKDYKGLGVGLYISREIIQMHGGELSVVSREKKGSTFTVKLPLK